MTVQERIQAALNIVENIKDCKVSPNNLYDLSLHLSKSIECLRQLSIDLLNKPVIGDLVTAKNPSSMYLTNGKTYKIECNSKGNGYYVINDIGNVTYYSKTNFM